MQASSSSRRAFTLLELMTVIAIIFILVTLLVGSYASLRGRAEKGSCVSNLLNLYSGASSYVQDQGHWPQVETRMLQGGHTQQYGMEWVKALSPYGVSRQNWVCPTVQRAMGNPDLGIDHNVRTDYNATPFDAKPRTAYNWATQPWFVEHASEHEGGPLLIYANGQVMSVSNALLRSSWGN